MLLTSQVFGDRAGQAAARRARREPLPALAAPMLTAEAERVNALYRVAGPHGLSESLDRLRRAMARVSIVRDEPALARCLEDIAEGEVALASARVGDPGDVWRALELQNLLLVGRLVATAARMRRETRGSHYRADYPESDEAAWGRSIVLRQVGDRLEHALASL